MLRTGPVLLALLAAACAPGEPEEKKLQFDFSYQEALGVLVSGFTDVAVAQDAEVGFLTDMRLLPSTVGLSRLALYQYGNNVSDDLFMFTAYKAKFLPANRNVDVAFSITLASNVGADCFSDHVWIKAGASTVQPGRIVTDGYSAFNRDKGNQAQEGTEALLLGTTKTTAPGCNSAFWAAKTLKSDRKVRARTNSEGELWLWFGHESGFEVAHGLYFLRMEATYTVLD